MKMSKFYCPIKPYTPLEVFLHFRVSVKYVIFPQLYHGNLHGHSGTLKTKVVENDSSDDEKKYKLVKEGATFQPNETLTKGEKEYHNGLEKIILNTDDLQLAVAKIGEYHLRNTISETDLINATCVRRYTFTISGHNLKDEDDRKSFAEGLRQERYKMAKILLEITPIRVDCPQMSRCREYFQNIVWFNRPFIVHMSLELEHELQTMPKNRNKELMSMEDVGSILMDQSNIKSTKAAVHDAWTKI